MSVYSTFRKSIVSAIAIVGIGGGTTANAQSWTDWGYITRIEAGWAADSMAVVHSAPYVNQPCSVVTDVYVTDTTDPGRSLYHSVALAAFLNSKQVRFLISGCAFGKPRIISVVIR